MRSENRAIIEEMALMLKNKPSLTLESFMMPHSEDDDDGYYDGDETLYDDNVPVKGISSGNEQKESINGIEKELTQIRKIALSVINRLADQPTCPQYDTMKKIWNMVDKAIEQPQTGNKPVE